MREEHGLVWLWWGSAEPAGDPPWFDTLGPDDSVVTVADTYPCHFTRFMENGLEVHHFAFVHHRILPFVGSQVEMKTADLDGDFILATGTLSPGPGERWRRLSDFAIEAYFPGLIHLDTLGLELLVAACPVDEEATWVAARYYRPRFGSGVLARAASWLAVQADYQTAQRQDKRVLRSIRPVVGSPHANMAVGADRAISLWYQRLSHTQQSRQAAERATGLAMSTTEPVCGSGALRKLPREESVMAGRSATPVVSCAVVEDLSAAMATPSVTGEDRW